MNERTRHDGIRNETFGRIGIAPDYRAVEDL